MQPGKTKIKQASANLPYLPTRCEARTGLGGWKSSQSQNAELSMQVREPRMDDNRASAADNLRKISPSCVGSEKFFLHCCLVRKIQFSSLSLRSGNENYYILSGFRWTHRTSKRASRRAVTTLNAVRGPWLANRWGCSSHHFCFVLFLLTDKVVFAWF